MRSETKSEYHGGVIVALAGASLPHNFIIGDIEGELRTQLEDKACKVVSRELRVSVPECERYYYPDVVVFCGDPKLEKNRRPDTLLNPTLIIEVLSDSTEATDKIEKLYCYRTIDSLKTYVLVAQDRPYIEIYLRQNDILWMNWSVQGLDATLALESIGCELDLSRVYARVKFP